MLVIARRVDESIAIGDTISVTVLGIEGDRVKLGITAPRDILILREEVFLAVQEQARLQEQLVDKPEPDTFKQLRELLETTVRDENDKSSDNPEENP